MFEPCCVVLLTVLANSSSSPSRTDAGEVIALLLAGTTMTARLRVTGSGRVYHWSGPHREC